MSSLFSDPPFPRGATLLNGEAIELDAAGNFVAGQEIVGQVKAFQDVAPGTGPASVRYSNRLVYCVAARYAPVTGNATINVDGADKGKYYALSRRGALTTFSDIAVTGDANTARELGILDEYLNIDVRPGDICWLVVKGPATANKANPGVIPAAAPVEISSTGGNVQASTTQANFVGQCIDPAAAAVTTAASGTGSNATVAISVPTTQLALIVAGAPITGHANLPAGAFVNAAPTNVVVSGATATATIAIAGTTATAVPSGTTLIIGGPNRTSTSVRVNLFSDSI
jgi:hypothetical protein